MIGSAGMAGEDAPERDRLVGVGVAIAATLLAGLANGSVGTPGAGWRPGPLAYAAVVGGLAASLVGIAALGRPRDAPVGLGLPSPTDLGLAALGSAGTLAVGAVGVAAIGSLGVAVPQPNLLEPALEGGPGWPTGPVRLLWTLPLVVLALVPAEEAVFRLAVQRRLAAGAGPRAAVAGSAGLFALYSVPLFAGGSAAATTLAAALVAILAAGWGELHRRTGNLLVPITAHAALYLVGLGALYWLAAGARA